MTIAISMKMKLENEGGATSVDHEQQEPSIYKLLDRSDIDDEKS